MTRKIGVFGGTFGPPHLGHTWAAEECQEVLGLDEVWFMPVGTHLMKDNILPAVYRMKMVEFALQDHDNPTFKLCDIEARTLLNSTTYNTMRTLTDTTRFPEHADIEFTFLCGSDVFRLIPENGQIRSILTSKWDNGEKLVENFKIGVIMREGQNILTAIAQDPVLLANRRNITPIVPEGMFDVSSTAIRNRIERGQSLRGRVHPSNIRYIEELTAQGINVADPSKSRKIKVVK